MAKEAMKKELVKRQGGVCARSGEELPDEMPLVDTDRQTPKAEGGTYDDLDNVIVVDPVAHMKRHGNYRSRDEQLEDLKEAVDQRAQTIKAFNKINNQLLAYNRRVDCMSEETVEFLQGLLEPIKEERKRLDKKVLAAFAYFSEDPLVKAALGVRAVGPMTVAHCIVYIDLNKARHSSSVWKYAGLHAASHERYVKGVAGGGNRKLRTAVYTMADSQVKHHGPYRVVYDQVKARLSVSERLVKTRNTQGKLIECAWKDTKPSHRHGAAMRAIMKHFLADYWWVGRSLAGLPLSEPYPVAKLGEDHKMIMPEERGWIY